jgi:cytoskeletal protein RodZ
MAEKVNTGGVMSFDYSKSGKQKLDENRKRDVEEAYLRADERKAKEKRNRTILWIVLVLVLIFLGILFLR